MKVQILLWSFFWGFYAHQLINRQAVFLLPPEMFGFYKYHIQYISENAVNPDQRRYIVKNEAPCHYIDLDIYGDSAAHKLPRFWKQAVEKYTEDSLLLYGIVPWHIEKVRYRLTQAFEQKNTYQILRLSADLGHYIGDANVPLHTTQNYNGQLSGQHGIHGFWESRLPELFAQGYDFFFENKAQYLKNPQITAWQAVQEAHSALDSVFFWEKELSLRMGLDKKYSFETRNKQNVRTYSFEFAQAYHQKLNGQVERRLRASIKMVADFWFTAWVNAGQPNLDDLLLPLDQQIIQQEKDSLQLSPQIESRPHEH